MFMLRVKYHKLVFVTLSDSLLISSHSLIFDNSLLIIISGFMFCAFTRLFKVLKRVVSSA